MLRFTLTEPTPAMLYPRHTSYAGYEAKIDEIVGLGAATKHSLGTGEDAEHTIWGISWGDLATKPVILMFNQHPWEPMAVQSIFEFMRLVIAGGFADPRGEDIRNTFAFYAIPTLVPRGYVNTAWHPNANGVNLNRNWDNHWEDYIADGYDQPFSTVYKGTAPWSEAETRVVRDLILNLQPVMIIDAHTSNYSGTAKGRSAPEWTQMLSNVYDSMLRTNIGGPTIEWARDPTLPGSQAWTGRQPSNQGHNVIPGMFEISHSLGYPPGEPGGIRYGINVMFLHCAYAWNWQVNRQQFFTSIRPQTRRHRRFVRPLDRVASARRNMGRGVPTAGADIPETTP